MLRDPLRNGPITGQKVAIAFLGRIAAELSGRGAAVMDRKPDEMVRRNDPVARALVDRPVQNSAPLCRRADSAAPEIENPAS
jgi:hypothetical protein